MSGAWTVLVDGRAQAGLPVQDRGLMYGDGVFRTLRIRGGRPLWWEAQLARLAGDCARLGIPCPERGLWQRDLAAVLEGRDEGVLKLVVTRGVGPRGYQPPEPARPTRIAMAGPLPGHPAGLWREGVHVRVCTLRLGQQPALAGIKHLNRLENVLARAEWDDADIHEGLLLDGEGRVISGVGSNLFILRGGELLTPRLDRCGVAGMARARLMAEAATLGLEAREADLALEDVRQADEAFLTNSLIGAWRVRRLRDASGPERVWPGPVIYPAVRKLLDG